MATLHVPLYRREGHGRWGEDVLIEQVALIDEDDFPLVSGYIWRLHTDGYATAQKGRLYMHRLLLGLATGDRRQGDHVNRDRLDNRRSNLRVVSKLENGRNQNERKRMYSQSPGVTWHRGRWVAFIQLDGKRKHLGQFDTEEEAAVIAAAARAERGW